MLLVVFVMQMQNSMFNRFNGSVPTVNQTLMLFLDLGNEGDPIIIGLRDVFVRWCVGK